MIGLGAIHLAEETRVCRVSVWSSLELDGDSIFAIVFCLNVQVKRWESNTECRSSEKIAACHS